MLIAPCSVKTLSGIAHCYNDELVVRAADVCLKERRRVVLLFRETPLHAGHIALMEQATRNGAIVMPPVPAFYSRPKTIDDLVMQTVGRALDLFDIDAKVVKRWTESAPAATAAQKAPPRQIILAVEFHAERMPPAIANLFSGSFRSIYMCAPASPTPACNSRTARVSM